MHSMPAGSLFLWAWQRSCSTRDAVGKTFVSHPEEMRTAAWVKNRSWSDSLITGSQIGQCGSQHVPTTACFVQQNNCKTTWTSWNKHCSHLHHFIISALVGAPLRSQVQVEPIWGHLFFSQALEEGDWHSLVWALSVVGVVPLCPFFLSICFVGPKLDEDTMQPWYVIITLW